ncbi:MAG: 5-deoxy-glucuronate isomerase [Proteobacteria bacterium]|nr:5-deoxy-glucuronate isomerase [Pseudomonadota bacterium]
MTIHIREHRNGFANGFTAVTRLDETEDSTGIAFGVLKLAAGTTHRESTPSETAWLLMSGAVHVEVAGESARFSRTSLFDESASCVHVSAETEVRLTAESDVELTVYRTGNRERFAAKLYSPGDVPDEHRGKGQVDDTCYRYVRTIFDRTSSDRRAELVLGEVVTMQGKWSSYPPHHHAQPEIYHYRFTRAQGFGFSQLGDDALQIKQYDTVKIIGGRDHAQAAAPGYGMYYSWVIRHLPGNPYTVPEFTEEHAWIMKPDAEYWSPQGDGGQNG